MFFYNKAVIALAALTCAVSSRPVPSFLRREVPQEHSHEKFLTSVRTSLNKNNPDEIVDPVFSLLGNAAAAQGLGKITDTECLQQAVADQAFTNAKADEDVQGMVDALIFRALERNTGSVGLQSNSCTTVQAVNPEIAAIQQHQDPASNNAAETNQAITLELARQIAAIGGDPLDALQAGTFAPGQIGDTTGAGNTCDDADDPEGCIFTQDLLVEDVSEDDINAAVADISASASDIASTDATAAVDDSSASATDAAATIVTSLVCQAKTLDLSAFSICKVISSCRRRDCRVLNSPTMTFNPFEVSIPHIVYAVIGGFVVIFGMFSLLIREKLYIGEAPLAFLFGIIIGPYCADIFNPRSWGGGDHETVNSITLEFTRVVLAIGVFAIGVELPKAYMARHWKSLFFLLVPVMTFGWIVCAGLIFALIPGLSFLSSLAVAACLTPTDPILAAAVVGGKYADKHVPAHLRHLLAAESGCNDGAAFPFLYLALYLVLDRSDRAAIQDWFLITWFYEVLLGTVFGALIGIAFRHLMKFCERKDLIDRQSYVAQYVALAMLVIGVTTMLGSDDLLAAFSCGAAFAWDGFFNRQTEQAVFSSVIDLLFNIAAFIFIGAWMPFSDFANEELTLSVWRLIVIAILILLLRRLPVVIALYKWIPDIKTFREAVFSGHFGPIGVGAVFISTLAAEHLPTPHESHDVQNNQSELLAASIQPIVAFMVLTSITIHGLSIPFFSLGRRVHSVSRTWSRHQSIDPLGPEWAMHTRRASRPEDIVINRDSTLERGEFRHGLIDEKEHHPAGILEHERISDSPTTPSSSLPSKTGDPEVRTEGRPDEPPDTDALEEEWREGSDVVIERQPAPGEEVEVQVKRGAAAKKSDEGEVLRTFRGSPGEVEHSVMRLKERLKEKAEQEKYEVEEVAKDISEEVGRRVRIAGIDTHASPSDSPRAGDRSPVRTNSHNDDEEGWASEGSDQRSRPSSSRGLHDSTDESPHKRSKSPKHKPGIKSHGHGSRRHRTSFRRNLLGKVRPLAPSTISKIPEPDMGDDDEKNHRGRQGSAGLPERIGHRRLESLRASAPSSPRSESPARSVRSVRFASDSGTATPAEERDSPSTPTTGRQVAFDLPDEPRP
ncbi:hypothetical protein ACEPAF_9813 [Sanghuangporus sanghuang]